MPTAQKAAIIDKAKKWYADSTGLIFTDYRGLDVPSLQTLRSSLRETGGEFHVVKNTLLRQAVGDNIAQFPDEFHNGPTATLFIFKDEAACAKVLVKFAKTNKGLEIKGGLIDGKPMTAEQIDSLSKLPSRDELLSMIVGLVAAPMSNVVGALNEIIVGPIRCIDAIIEKQGGAPAPAAEPEAAAATEEAPAASTAPDPEEEKTTDGGPQSVDDEPATDDGDADAAGPQSVDDQPAKDDDSEAAGPQSVDDEPAPDSDPDPAP
ncbi:MAG: 50S ribosomal protein L10 [Armatimonadota bacterium]|nr:50S ribosomal protein L10 [Armatimonadota bacterium]